VDNFQLWLIGRQVSIDWTMETPTHGTIILPFAVSEENLDAELELYNLTAQVESKAQGATHHVLQLSETPQRFIEANTPYVVKVRNAEQELSTKAVKVAGKREVAQATGKTYTFSGFTENEKMNYTDTYTNGNLTGVLVETKVADDQYHLQSYEDNVGFVLHSDGVDDGAEHETVAPYHAYITIPEEAQGEENIHGLYFEEPTLPLDWYMEGQYYGTIILPFEAEVPEDMNAYTVAGIKDEDKKAMPGVENAYYHLLTIEPVEEVNGVRTFKANVPYLVVMKSAEETQTPEVETPAEPLSLKVAIREAETDAPTATFRGQATNTNASDKYGLLTGVHVDTALADDDQLHMIAEDEKTGAFMSMKGSQAGQIDAHHAYISSADLPEDHGEYLLLAEPKTDEPTSVEEILANSEPVDIYTPAGVVVRRQVVAAEALRELAPGIYIISNDKASVKIIKR
ncbi:MAG: hypothetical protein K2K97_10070, partial [Muribaculaceae bacterium]|nr:hypothetical protein [Muribaculaceae bacterium]